LEAKKAIHAYTAAANNLLDPEDSDLTDNELMTYKEPWCRALRLAYGRKESEPICDDSNGFRLGKVWFYTKCLFEECVDGSDTQAGCLGHNGTTKFVLLTELYDALMKQMPDVQMHLNELEQVDLNLPESCPGESDVFLLKVKQQQQSMLARHHKIQQALAQTRTAAESLLATESTSLLTMASDEDHAVESFQRVWEDICGPLKCDHGSWTDVADAMHGHVVDLAAERMPARYLIEHVRSFRKTHDAMAKAFGKFTSAELDDLVSNKNNVTAHPRSLSLFEVVTKQTYQQSGTQRYEALGKEILGVADAAYAVLHGSKTPLTWFKFCFKVIVGGVVAFVKGIPLNPSGTLKFFFGITGSCGGSVDMVKVFTVLFDPEADRSGLGGVNCGLSAFIEIGLGLSDPSGSYGVRVGINTVFGASYTFAKNEGMPDLSISIGVVAAIKVVWPGSSSTCPLGLTSIGPLACKNVVSLGIGFVCAKYTLLPDQKAHSYKEKPTGPTAYGRECSRNSCGNHGYSYKWCYTESSWDYCCPANSGDYAKTTRDANCYKPCAWAGYDYKWCYTDSSNRWDYCCFEGKGTSNDVEGVQGH
jgi:hypothetical protein